jgi:hypothetical protein
VGPADPLETFGTDEPVAPARRLSAGSLSCWLSEGGLRDVRWCDVEVVRGISYLFRDRDWGTSSASVERLAVEESRDAFRVRFDLRIATPEGCLNAEARIEGRSSGELDFEVIAAPDAPLETNRCGFVVLHPAAVAGSALRVEHTDGRVSDTEFPLEISPAQPVFDIRALAHSPCEGVEAACRLEADLPHDPAGKFEMEDQRNWSDASFKTYVASLLDPWPYVLPAGKRLAQRISVRMTGRPRVAAQGSADRSIEFGSPGAATMPEIGVGVPPGLHRADPREVDALRGLRASWWIAEATLDQADVSADLAAVAAHRRGLPVRVQLDMVVPDSLSAEEAAARSAAVCEAVGLAVDAVRLLAVSYLKSFQPSDRWPDLPPLEEYARAARKSFPHARVGGGMFTYFTELNRKRPSADELDFIGHATCPIVHAADDRSVMQTMEALPHIVSSVRAAWPGMPYRLGPSAIAMRRNPYGDAPASNPRRERVPLAAVDPRHGARFGVAWVVAYAATVAPLGLELLALLDGHGPSGPLPREVRERLGQEEHVPAWTALAQLAEAAGAPIVPLEGLPLQVSGIGWATAGKARALLANLAHEPCSLRWSRPVQVEDGTSVTHTTLAPFETLRIGSDLRKP